jgi:hypothetical protein
VIVAKALGRRKPVSGQSELGERSHR